MKKILIAAPYYRCGSTLVQRCFHQCENTYIAGELNNIFSIVDLLMKTSNVPRDNSKKAENWHNKVDDDYSLCYNKDTIRYLGENIIDIILGKDIPIADSNYGFKIIGPTMNDLNIADKLGYHVVYIKRNMKDALRSYLNQDWSSLFHFNTAYSRSLPIEQSLNQIVNSNSDIFSLIEYENVNEDIYKVLDKLELKYDKEKIENVLSNKINPGYYTEKELEKISTK